MREDKLDDLLSVYAETPVDTSRLSWLESDVRRNINAQAVTAATWPDIVSSAFAIPQFRAASLGMAVMLGLLASPAFVSHASPQSPLGLDMFTMRAPYLTDNMMAKNL